MNYEYQDKMIEHSKRDRRVWEESALGKQYALARNQIFMENSVSDLGFEEIQELIQKRVNEMNK